MALTNQMGCKDEAGNSSDIFRIKPIQYLKVMCAIAKESFIHPNKTTVIDYETVEVINRY